MNSVSLTGRLTKDVQCAYDQKQNAWARITLAVSRGKKNGEDLGADFPTIVVFDKTAENCERYLKKGSMIAVSGEIRTGKYEKDGRTIYTTEVYAKHVDFLDKKEDKKEEVPQGFESIDDIDF